MIIFIVNDDEYDAQCCVNDARTAFPDAKIVTFDSLYKAHTRSVNPDVLIVDLSSVAPLALGCAAHHYGPICTFLERRPGTTVFITSAVSQEFAASVKEDVLNIFSEAQIHVVEWPWHTKLIETLTQVA